MKIYPCTHKIQNVESVSLSEDIPLGYLDSEFMEDVTKLSINNKYDKDVVKELLPYSLMDSLELTLYDKNKKALSLEEQGDIITRQESGSYMYKPKASMVFEPHTFDYRVLAKKNMRYSSSRKYNIKVACDNTNLANKMIQFLADANERGLCPTNVMFNNNDRKIESLYNSSFEDVNIMFIESFDGKNLINEEPIPLDAMIEANTIPWIICDKLPDQEEPDYDTNRALEFEIDKNYAINTKSFKTKYYFKYPKALGNKINNNPFKHYDEFSPIVIEETVNKGHIVYCNSDFMANLNRHLDVFYEIMINIYLQSYISTQTINEWIADVMPDYIVQNGRLTQKDKFTSHMELHKLLGLQEGDAEPIEVKIFPPNENKEATVYYTGMSSNYLVFKKIPNAEYADPKKSTGQISIFTERKNIMFYDNFVYIIEDSIVNKISHEIKDKAITVNVAPFKNTFLDTRNFVNNKVVTLEIDKNFDKEFYIAWDTNKKDIALVKELKDHLSSLAKLTIESSEKSSKLYDMRRRGGGLPDDIDNFDCLDIGHVLGRPYRKGGTVFVTISLPLKYEYIKNKLHNIIYESIRKNMVSDDYVVLDLKFE